MTDKEILGEVYTRLLKERENYRSQVQGWLVGDPIINFIEQEWQRQDEIDEQEQKDVYADSLVVSEIERHRGLVIGEDGTVNDLK